MIVMDKYIDYLNNPNPQTKRALINGMVSTMVYTSAAIAIIDLLKAGLLGGFWGDDDDEEKMLTAFNRNIVINAFAPFYGVNQAARMIYTNLDGERWSARIEHPIEGLINNGMGAIEQFGNGNIDKGVLKTMNLLLMSKGLPAEIVNMPMKVGGNIFSDK